MRHISNGSHWGRGMSEYDGPYDTYGQQQQYRQQGRDQRQGYGEQQDYGQQGYEQRLDYGQQPQRYRPPDHIPTERTPRPPQFRPSQQQPVYQPERYVPDPYRPDSRQPVPYQRVAGALRPTEPKTYGLHGAEPFWYVLGCVAFGAAYLGKLPAKKAACEILTELHLDGGGPGRGYTLTGIETFWYVLMCLPFGGAYFAKVWAKKALWEMVTLLQDAPEDYRAPLARALYG